MEQLVEESLLWPRNHEKYQKEPEFPLFVHWAGIIFCFDSNFQTEDSYVAFDCKVETNNQISVNHIWIAMLADIYHAVKLTNLLL